MPAAGEGRSAVLGLVLLQARLQLGPEVADETLDGPGGGVAESAYSTTLDLFAIIKSMVR